MWLRCFAKLRSLVLQMQAQMGQQMPQHHQMGQLPHMGQLQKQMGQMQLGGGPGGLMMQQGQAMAAVNGNYMGQQQALGPGPNPPVGSNLWQ